MNNFNFFRGNDKDVPTSQEISRSNFLTIVYEQGFRAGMNGWDYDPPEHYHASRRVLNTWRMGYRDAEQNITTRTGPSEHRFSE